MTPIPTVLLGAGKSGTALGRALRADRRIDLVGVQGGAGASAAALARDLDIPVLNPSQEFAPPGTALAVIATPHSQHVAQIVAALDAGCDVLVDKPAAMDREGLDLVLRAAQQAGRRVFVGFVQRCGPDMTSCRRFLSGRLDAVRSIFVQQILVRDTSYYDGWKGDPALAGGGLLLNQAIHAVDLAFFLTGASPLQVSATVTMTRPIQVEDAAVASMTTDGPVVALAAATHARVQEEQTIRIHLDDATVLVVGTETPRWAVVAPESGGPEDRVAALAADAIAFGGQHAVWLDDCLQAILQERPSEYGTELAGTLDAHLAVFAMYESASASGKAVPVRDRVRG